LLLARLTTGLGFGDGFLGTGFGDGFFGDGFLDLGDEIDGFALDLGLTLVAGDLTIRRSQSSCLVMDFL
jgi:hypothetical protein